MKVLTGHLLITRVFTHPESGERRLLVEDYHGRHKLQVHDSYSSRRLNKLGNLLNFKDIPPNRVVRIYDNFVLSLGAFEIRAAGNPLSKMHEETLKWKQESASFNVLDKKPDLNIRETALRKEVMNALHQWLADRELYRDFNEFLRNS